MLNYTDPHPNGAPAVILLHGLGVTRASWALQFPPLIENGYRPIAPDAIGFGGSRYDGRGWSIARCAAAVADLIEALKTGPAHIVGISMGGTIAQQLAFDHPLLVKKLVLVNTFAVLRPGSFNGWLYFLWRFALVHTLGLPTQARFVARRIFPRPDQAVQREMMIAQILQADPRAYRAAMRSLGIFNSSRRLAQISAPTLVVTAENDSTVAPANQRVLVENIPGARQVLVPAAGHAVTIDQPERFNQAMLDFLK
jgi:pimeloyl-ACP methyl ester carboxylesterase